MQWFTTHISLASTIALILSLIGCSKESDQSSASAAAVKVDVKEPTPSESPSDKDVIAYLEKRCPGWSVTNLERADFMNDLPMPRISVKAALVLNEDLYDYVRFPDKSILAAQGLTEADLLLLKDVYNEISAKPFYRRVTEKKATGGVRGELFCRNTVDGWEFRGTLKSDREVPGIRRRQLRADAVALEGPQITAFFESVKRAKKDRQETIASLENEKDRRVEALKTWFANGQTLRGMWRNKHPFRITFTEDLNHERDANGVIRLQIHGNIEWPEGPQRISASGARDLSRSPNAVIEGHCYWRPDDKSVLCELYLSEWDPGFNQFTGGDRTSTFSFDGERFTTNAIRPRVTQLERE